MVLENRRVTPEFADCTIIRKWKWLFVNGCQRKRPISGAMGFYTHAKMCKMDQCVWELR